METGSSAAPLCGPGVEEFSRSDHLFGRDRHAADTGAGAVEYFAGADADGLSRQVPIGAADHYPAEAVAVYELAAPQAEKAAAIA